MKLLRKPLCVLLTFILLVNANISVFAQNISASTNDFVLGSATLRAEIKERLNIIDEHYIKDFYRYETRLQDAIYDVDYQGKINNYGEVCYNDICAPFHTYMRGLIGALLEFAEGDWEILQNYITEIRNAAFAAAIASDDIPQIKEILKTIVEKNKSNCGNVSVFEGLWETAQENLNIKDKDFFKEKKARNSCKKALDSLTILAVLTESAQDARNTADYIYRFLKKYQNDTYANLVLMETIAALTFIDTDYSYSLIEQFLTQDTAPSITGNKAREALSMFMPSGIFESVRRQILEENLHETKYLNRYNERWQYINLDATEKEGISSFWLSNAAYNAAKDSKVSYRIVFNNILTDVGDFLSGSGVRGEKLSKKIVNQYINASEENRQTIHLPLILGLIQNLDLQDAKPAAEILNKNFYYDINGGTGKMIAGMTALPNSGLVANTRNTISESAFHTLQNTRNALMAVDIIAALISFILLARSIPGIISGLKNLRTFRSISRIKSVAKVENVANATRNAPVLNQALVGGTATSLVFGTKTALPALKASQTTLSLAPVVSKTAGISNTLNAAAKFRRGLQGKGFLSKPQFALTSGKAAQHTANTSAQTAVANAVAPITEEAAQPSQLIESVFNIMDDEYQFSGFLTEIPMFGVNRQVVISVGHGVSHNPTESFSLFNSAEEYLTEANVAFYKLIRDPETGSIKEDFAILLPHERLPQRPLDLVFNPQIEKYSKIFSVGYPNLNFTIRSLSQNSAFSKYNYGKDLTLFDGRAVKGVSGGVVLAETEPNKFAAIGTTVANATNGKLNFTAMYNLNWLQKFLRGQLDVSKLWAPNFRISFVKPDKAGNLPDIPFNDGITKPDFSVNPSKFALAPTSNTNFASPAGLGNFSTLGNAESELSNSVFRLENGKASGTAFLTEASLWGEPKRQLLITVGHLVSNSASSPLSIYTRFGEKVGEGRTLFYNFDNTNKNFLDFAIVLPNSNLPFEPLKFSVDKNLYDFKNALTIGYPQRTFDAHKEIPDPRISDVKISNVKFLRGGGFPGASGSPVFVETSPNSFEVVGNIVGGELEHNRFTAVQNLSWFNKFINGKYVFGYYPYNFFKLEPIAKPSFSVNPIKATQQIEPIRKPSILEDDGLPSLDPTSFPLKPAPASNAENYLIDLDNTPWNSITQMEPVDRNILGVGSHAVVLLKDAQGNIVTVVKYGTYEEVGKLVMLNMLVRSENLAQKYPLIKFNYPRIIAQDEIPLPENIQNQVSGYMHRVKRNLWGINRGVKPFAMTPVNTNGFKYYNVRRINKRMIMDKLRGKPITFEEWEQLENLYRDLNAGGFVHPDFFENTVFERNADGVLEVNTFDPEAVNAKPASNEFDLDILGEALDRIGARDMNSHSTGGITLNGGEAESPAVGANGFNGSPLIVKTAMPRLNFSGKPSFELQPLARNKRKQLPRKQIQQQQQEQIDELAKSVLRLENSEIQASGFLTEIPFGGSNRQAIISVGHIYEPGKKVFDVIDSKGNFLTKADIFFSVDYEDNGFFRSVQHDYSLLFPHERIDAPALPLALDRNFSDFNKFKTFSFPIGQFVHKDFKRIPAPKDISFTPNIGFLSGKTYPGSSGGVVLAKTGQNKYSAIGTIIGRFVSNSGKYVLIHSLDWLKNFIETGIFIPEKIIKPDFPEGPLFNILNKIRNGIFKPQPKQLRIPTVGHVGMEIIKTAARNPSSLSAGNSLEPFAFDRPYLPISHFSEYENATLFPMGNIGQRTNPMWGISNVYGNINKFMRYGTEQDVRNMHLFGKMIEENGLQSRYQLITVDYPQFISVIDEGVPSNVWEDIAEIKGNVRYHSDDNLMLYTTTPLRTNGAIWLDKDAGVNERFLANSDFTNNPITEDEWDEVLALVQDINNNDFILDDFEKSVIFRRNSAGQLVLGFTKIKHNPLATDNYTDAIEMGRKLERVGLKTDKHGAVRKPTQTTRQDVAKILNGVTRAEIVVTEYESGKMVVHAVWRLYDNHNKIVGYLKFGTEDEIINTRKVEKVFTENDLVGRFNNHINVKFSRILADNADDLPPEILRKVYAQFEANKGLIRDAKDRAKQMFVLSPVDEDVFCWGNIGRDSQSIYTALARLGGYPIKAEAWEEFYNLMFTLQKLGVRYDDVYNNIAFKGKRGEKLDVIFTDFENEGTDNMLLETRNLGRSLTANGLKENNLYLDNLEFWVKISPLKIKNAIL